mmetsp:Transcript_30281/g.46368  ORF Transcript_30281/g.46368 Transcript_30281/m.46368 type:complete len:108 (+) Transcript_30281:1-324(+)
MYCAVYDFWEARVVAFTRGSSYTTKQLPQFSSALLRITPIVANKQEHPILVGSNLHLSMGATEIKDIIITTTTTNNKNKHEVLPLLSLAWTVGFFLDLSRYSWSKAS